MLLSILSVVFSLAGLGDCMPQGDQLEKKCKEYSEFGYFCVPYYQCDALNKIITDGIGLVDPRQVDDDECREPDPSIAVTSKCDKLLEVCCRHPSNTTPEKCLKKNVDEPKVNKKEPDICNTKDYVDIFEDDDNGEVDIFGNDDNGEVDIFGNDDNGDVDIFGVDEDDNCGIFEPGPAPGSPGQCGKRNNVGVTSRLKKASIDDAKFGEWPHVCAVLKKEYIGDSAEPLMVYQCGASLVADSVVLTAGHCVNDTKSLENRIVVRCGEWDTQSEEEILPYQEIDVEKIQIHPDFNVDNHHNNFAVLFLKSPFELTDHISPVCLPKPGEVLSEQNCVSHGWGKDKFGAEGRYSTILKEVVVPLVDNDRCQQDLRVNTRLGTYFELDSSFICAGGQKDIDTCKGDGGSPLTCKQPQGPWFQAGIVSWGIGCGENKTPAVYANVAQASCWIDNAVQCYLNLEESFFGFETGDCTKDCGQF